MPDRQLMVFRSPDWEDGYGGDLLTEPPPERTAWCDPDDRDGLAAMLLECARDTIAQVGWRPEFKKFEPSKWARSPIWRKKLNMTSHWAGHVWDACMVEPDGSFLIHLRLMVRFVDWQFDDGSVCHVGYDTTRLQPHIPLDIEEDCFSLVEGRELSQPVKLDLSHYDPRFEDLLELDETDLTFRPDDREGIEAALVKAATRVIEAGSEKYGWPPEAVVDSHFGRWIALQKQPSDEWFWDRYPTDEEIDAARKVYAAADVGEKLPSTWAGHIWEAWGAEPGDHERYPEQSGALYLRLTVRDVVWREGRIEKLVYDLEPRLRDRRTACVQNIPAAPPTPGPAQPVSPATV